MSRTLRRIKKHQVLQFCGTFEEFVQWELRYPPISKYRKGSTEFDRHAQLDLHRKYVRKIVRYTRDHHSGHYGVPRWYRQMNGALPMRRRENGAIRRRIENNCWDDHLPESRCRSHRYYWW